MCAMVSGNTCPFCLHSRLFKTLMVCPCSISDWTAVGLLRGSATCSFHVDFGGISRGLNSVTSCRRAICISLLPVWKQMWFLFGFPTHGTSYTNWEPCQSTVLVLRLAPVPFQMHSMYSSKCCFFWHWLFSLSCLYKAFRCILLRTCA